MLLILRERQKEGQTDEQSFQVHISTISVSLLLPVLMLLLLRERQKADQTRERSFKSALFTDTFQTCSEDGYLVSNESGCVSLIEVLCLYLQKWVPAFAKCVGGEGHDSILFSRLFFSHGARHRIIGLCCSRRSANGACTRTILLRSKPMSLLRLQP